MNNLIKSLLGATFTLCVISNIQVNINKVDAETTKSSWVSSLDTTGTIFYSPTSEEVKEYYSSISTSDKGDNLLSKLQNILKEGQKKVIYNTGATSSHSTSYGWTGYYLYERDYVLSPLTQTEINNNRSNNYNFKTSGIWVNSLYCKSPVYLDRYINNGTFKYYTDWNEETHSGTQLATGTFNASSDPRVNFDREHVFPKSYGFNGTGNIYEKLTSGCDAHNLHMGEHIGNSDAHSNFPYGDVVDKNASTTNKYYSGITGELVGYVGIDKFGSKVYEPNEEDKGDIARTLFYMAARYHDYEIDPNATSYHTPRLSLGNINNKTSTASTQEPEDTEFRPAMYGQLETMLKWNKIDPVSDEEIRRNDLVHLGIQGNRNPFIDFPSWAEVCFNNGTLSFDDIDIRKVYLGEEVIKDDTPNIVKDFEETTIKANIGFDFDEKIIEKEEIDTHEDTYNLPMDKGLTTSFVDNFKKGTESGYTYESSNKAHKLNNTDSNIVFKIPEDTKNLDITINCYATGNIDSPRSSITYTFVDSSNNVLSSDGPYSYEKTETCQNIKFDVPNGAAYLKFIATKASNSNFWIKGMSITASSVAQEKNSTKTYDNFRNIKLSFAFDFNFKNYQNTDYQSSGILFIKEGNVSNYIKGSKLASLPTGTNYLNCEVKDYLKSEFIASLYDIPVSGYKTNVVAVPYIKVNNEYYLGNARSESVYSLLSVYVNDNTMEVNLDEETTVLVSDFVKPFYDSII